MSESGTYWSTWQKLSFSEKLIFLKAAICLILIKCALTVLPFPIFRKLFHGLTSSKSTKEFKPEKVQQIAWSVDTAANILPFELLCLPRALATKYLLRKMPSLTLEIGIEVNPAKKFEAHAWVEKNGRIIIGDWPKTVSYQRLWVWE
ncbi:lasso peptide biosynthesis B2 protein [Dyadobacter luticola]|uniref:Lasso peptide biosynthesis B2 protein n=1 Tax=Dyadobacter luticola TaxID=1979387 RepID=A0A5R9KYD0_9BACT|nr:lasso peptide biosynthesis B2 protein [Dyadobacter luticola]TLV01168.1 lasso peptide biosynthesis B2 protein [Dyadobacter luticola]